MRNENICNSKIFTHDYTENLAIPNFKKKYNPRYTQASINIDYHEIMYIYFSVN